MIRAARVYSALHAAYGPQNWWPAEDRFEIMVGALLVQRTTWRNAEAAVALLRQHGLVEPARAARASVGTLEHCVRRAGFYRTKAARLRELGRAVEKSGGMGALAAEPTAALRAALLEMEGIGPETADAILLYAFERPVVVVDAYLRRFAARLGGCERAPDDEAIRRWIRRDITETPKLNELHALVVAHAKAVCLSTPRCPQCALRKRCRQAG